MFEGMEMEARRSWSLREKSLMGFVATQMSTAS